MRTLATGGHSTTTGWTSSRHGMRTASIPTPGAGAETQEGGGDHSLEGRKVGDHVGNSNGNHTAPYYLKIYPAQSWVPSDWHAQDGPVNHLNDTKYAQLVLLTAALFAIKKTKARGGKAREDEEMKRGGCAESMAAAAQRSRPDKMLSVIGVDNADIRPLVDQAKSLPADTVLEVANYLSSQGRVVSGHKAALDASGKLAIQKGAMRATLLEDPVVPVYSKLFASQMASCDCHLRCEEHPELLSPQWESTFRTLIQANKENMLEVGS
eukprot:jgi/Chlat1/5516/Chrsp360S05331